MDTDDIRSQNGNEIKCSRDETDRLDITNLLPDVLYTKLQAKKWSERKEALESLEKSVANASSLSDGSYDGLIAALKNTIAKDSNVLVVVAAVKCITRLAIGLGKSFRPYVEGLMPVLFDKFKEKKPNVVVALRESVDAIFSTTTLDLLLENIACFLDNKNSNVKAEVALFLNRCLTKHTGDSFNKKLLKPLAKALLPCIGAQDPIVRENVIQAVGSLMKLVGETHMEPLLASVDNQKMIKIKEYYEKIKSPARPSYVKPEVSMSSARPAETSAAAGDAITLKFRDNAKHNMEKISKAKGLEIGKRLIPASVLKGLSDCDKSKRLQSHDEFYQAVLRLDGKSQETGQVLLFTLQPEREKAEQNPDILTRKLQIIKHVADNLEISEESVSMLFLHIVTALCLDISHLVDETLWAIARNITLESVARILVSDDAITYHPDLRAKSQSWLSSAIVKIGHIANPNFIIERTKLTLQPNVYSVRDPGLVLIGAAYLLSPLYVPKKNSTPPINVAPQNLSKDKLIRKPNKRPGKDTKTPILGDEFPSNQPTNKISRIDISLQISEQLISEFDSRDWHVRAEAIAKLQTIISDAGNITPNIGEALRVITSRLNDSNSKIAASAIMLLDSLAPALGSQCKQFVREFLPSLVKIVGDHKTTIRTAAIKCMTTWADIGGYKEFFEGEIIANALKTGTPSARSELWFWLGEKLLKIPTKVIAKDDLIACLTVLYSSLEDRNADVRKHADKAVVGFMMHLGFKPMISACNNMKGTTKAQVKEILEKARGILLDKPSKEAEAEFQEPASTPTPSPSKHKSVKRSAGSRESGQNDETGPLLQVNDMKHQRAIDEQKLKSLKWNFDRPGPEFVELLRDQMVAASVNKTLVSNFFHNDFKYHLRAIELLTDDLQQNRASLMSNLDLILRWTSLRFFDTNPAVLSKSLEYLNKVYDMLIKEEYVFPDREASGFIPYLVLKIGDQKDAVRQNVRELLKKMSKVYPQTKQFSFVMDGVKSKNGRQRAECLEHLSWLIENYGLGVCHPSVPSALKSISNCIADRDVAVRNAAINLLVTAYCIGGERICRIVSHLPSKEFSLLQERIKRVDKTKTESIVTAEPKELQFVSTPIVKETAREDASECQETLSSVYSTGQPRQQSDESLESYSSAMDIESKPPKYALDQQFIQEIEFSGEIFHAPELVEVDLKFLQEPNTQKEPMVKMQMPITSRLSQSTVTTKKKWEPPQISSSNIDKAMESIAQIDGMLKSDDFNLLHGYVDHIINQLILQLAILKLRNPTDAARCYHAIFAVLINFTSNAELFRCTEDTLYRMLMQCFLLVTTNPFKSMTNCDDLDKLLNHLNTCVLERSDKSNVMYALFKMLFDSIDSLDMTSEFQNLVLKAIWKLNRNQSNWDSQFNYAKLLSQFNVFLKDFPSNWWEGRDNLPLRTVKAILESMVKFRGVQVAETIAKMSDIASDSKLNIYVEKLMKHFKIRSKNDKLEKQKQRLEAFKVAEEARNKTKLLDRSKLTESHPTVDLQLLSSQESSSRQVINTSVMSRPGTENEEFDNEKLQPASSKIKVTKAFSKEAKQIWNKLQHLQEKIGSKQEDDLELIHESMPNESSLTS